jgi:hypothetical protein
MKDELAFIEKCKAEKAHLLTLTNETEIESTLKDVEYYIESNNLAIFKDNNPIGKRQYQLTDLGKKLKELKTFEALEKYCEKEKFKEEEKRELELIKLRREVYFLRDPRYWLGVASGAITTAIAIIGIYLAWLHR